MTLAVGQISFPLSRTNERAFRERHEVVRDATGPSRLSNSLRAVVADEAHRVCPAERVTYGSRGRTAQGPSNATRSHSVKAPARGAAGSGKPLIRRVRNADAKGCPWPVLGWSVSIAKDRCRPLRAVLAPDVPHALSRGICPLSAFIWLHRMAANPLVEKQLLYRGPYDSMSLHTAS